MTSERFNELLSDCKPSNLKKGVKAIKELYRFSVPIICKFIDKRYKQNIGMDIAHDFIVAIPYRNISYTVKTPTAWLRAVADNNMAKNYFKRDSRQRGAHLTAVDQPPQIDPFDKAVYLECLANIQKLDPESCHIVTKCYIEGYSSEEVGAQLQMKSGTVRQKCARSLKKLRDM